MGFHMDWLQRNRLVALSVVLGVAMMVADLLMHAVPYRHSDWLSELPAMHALGLGLPLGFLLLPALFGLYAQSLLQRVQQAAAKGCDSGHSLNTVIEDTPPPGGEQSLTAAVFESTNQGIIIIDRMHSIVSVNPAFIALTGYTQDEVRGKNPLHLKSSRHNEAFFENIWRSLEKKGCWEGEIWSRRKNGETYPSWHSISPIYNSGTGKLEHYVSVFTDITPIKRQQANMDLLAYHDPLTGLPNRLLFTERLQHALSVLTRVDNRVALLFFDLDGFKDINDTLGHTVGDSLLQAIADRMQSTLRDGDTVARFGGDEFVILTESCDSRAGLEKVAEKIIEEISRPVQVNEQIIVVQASVGIAIAPADGVESQALIQAADKAMYRAKAYAGSHFCFYDEAEATGLVRKN
ncbi:MAG TPA: diguanylate cyclase [Gammaproteobacteria bacterium]|nr:diguanylate cyclase [Gammaproteobacteria bacterium]